MRLRRSWLTNRFAVTFGGIAVAAALWNLYVVLNDDGIIRGRVVDAEGVPVEGAAVVLSERSLLVARPRGRTVTDAEGRFAFSGHRLHRLYLEASKEGSGRIGQREYRLYFKGQNMELDAPLQLRPEGAT
jgi:hypothetical protein